MRPDPSGGFYRADAKTGKRVDDKVSDAKKTLGVEEKSGEKMTSDDHRKKLLELVDQTNKHYAGEKRATDSGNVEKHKEHLKKQEQLEKDIDYHREQKDKKFVEEGKHKVGETKSGKQIYHNDPRYSGGVYSHPEHQRFSTQDHRDAIDLHAQKWNEKNYKRKDLLSQIASIDKKRESQRYKELLQEKDRLNYEMYRHKESIASHAQLNRKINKNDNLGKFWTVGYSLSKHTKDS